MEDSGCWNWDDGRMRQAAAQPARLSLGWRLGRLRRKLTLAACITGQYYLRSPRLTLTSSCDRAVNSSSPLCRRSGQRCRFPLASALEVFEGFMAPILPYNARAGSRMFIWGSEISPRAPKWNQTRQTRDGLDEAAVVLPRSSGDRRGRIPREHHENTMKTP